MTREQTIHILRVYLKWRRSDKGELNCTQADISNSIESAIRLLSNVKESKKSGLYAEGYEDGIKYAVNAMKEKLEEITNKKTT